MADRPVPDPRPAPTPERQWQQADSHRVEAEFVAIGAPLSDERRAEFLNTRDGVFYPTGHAAFVLDPVEARTMVEALGRAGFGRDDWLWLDAARTAELMRASEEQAGLLAEVVGAEIKDVTVIRQLADNGAGMLIVRARNDDDERALLEAARGRRVHKALRYHTLAIEELPVGSERIPGDSPFGVNEVLRNKPSDAQMKTRR